MWHDMIAAEYGIFHYFFFPRAVEVGTESQKSLTLFFGFVKEIKKSRFLSKTLISIMSYFAAHKKGRHESFSSLPAGQPASLYISGMMYQVIFINSTRT